MSDCMNEVIKEQMLDEMIGTYGYPDDWQEPPAWLVDQCFNRMWEAFDDVMLEYMEHYQETDPNEYD